MNISEKILNESAEGLAMIESGKTTLDDFLDSIDHDAGIRKTVASILFTYYRNKTFTDLLIKEHVKKKTDAFLLNIVKVALTQTLFQSGIAKESAVNIAVAVAKNEKGQFAGNFVNAVLRNCGRTDLEEFRRKLSPAAKLNMPEYLYSLWLNEYGEEKLKSIAELAGKESSFSLRLIRDLPPELMESCKTEPLADESWSSPFRFCKCGRPEALFKSGVLENADVYVQDMSAAAALSLLAGLDRKPGTIADVCAAPGGKTLMLSELFPDAEITAFDRSERRLKLASENFTRYGRNIKTAVADAMSLKTGASFSLVLADLPCSNTGVIRKRPDAAWRFNAKSLEETVAFQKRILESCAGLVSPDGMLLYSTCSIEDAENGKLVREFCGKFPFRLEKEICLFPDENHEGAYGALLIRQG